MGKTYPDLRYRHHRSCCRELCPLACVDILITDHHDLPNPFQKPSRSPTRSFCRKAIPLHLSGSGVAYKLAEELYGRFGRSDEVNRHLDLATLGLVSDLAGSPGMPLPRPERVAGTQKHATPWLADDHGNGRTRSGQPDEEHIGFVLGPRLNALGRLGDANPAVELLTTSDPVRARVLATQLEGLNTQRQLLCNQVTRAAESQLRAEPSLLASPFWSSASSLASGVVGIVASRLVERYHKPVILFSTPPANRRVAQPFGRRTEYHAAIAARKSCCSISVPPMAAVSRWSGKIGRIPPAIVQDSK